MIEEDDELDNEDPEAILPDLFREDPEDEYDPMDLDYESDDYDNC